MWPSSLVSTSRRIEILYNLHADFHRRSFEGGRRFIGGLGTNPGFGHLPLGAKKFDGVSSNRHTIPKRLSKPLGMSAAPIARRLALLSQNLASLQQRYASTSSNRRKVVAQKPAPILIRLAEPIDVFCFGRKDFLPGQRRRGLAREKPHQPLTGVFDLREFFERSV
jgi:hypothetical protein